MGVELLSQHPDRTMGQYFGFRCFLNVDPQKTAQFAPKPLRKDSRRDSSCGISQMWSGHGKLDMRVQKLRLLNTGDPDVGKTSETVSDVSPATERRYSGDSNRERCTQESKISWQRCHPGRKVSQLQISDKGQEFLLLDLKDKTNPERKETVMTESFPRLGGSFRSRKVWFSTRYFKNTWRHFQKFYWGFRRKPSLRLEWRLTSARVRSYGAVEGFQEKEWRIIQALLMDWVILRNQVMWLSREIAFLSQLDQTLSSRSHKGGGHPPGTAIITSEKVSSLYQSKLKYVSLSQVDKEAQCKLSKTDSNFRECCDNASSKTQSRILSFHKCIGLILGNYSDTGFRLNI